ncbi:dynein regulatory complex subunit 2-like [Prorops nasuta]|uniref:dynein regulatory complex subunit 2-like n=1 Tax=Prorops nasuta TaxID=863751 RepID=UPI0034D0072D
MHVFVSVETKEHKASYEALYAKDQKDREVANRQNAYLSNLYKDIQWLKGQMTACQLQNEKKIQDMTKERNFFFDSYQSLKTKVQQDEKLEKDRLISLAIEHDHTMEHLRKFLSKAANLSMIVEACEKYRVTEDQQILPFRTVAQMNESPLAVLNSELCMHEQIANDYDLLSGFWQQVGRTYFSIEAMRKERDELRWKNNSLKMNLRQYIRQSNVIG